MMTRIKVCGLTRPEDAKVADECGVDAVGLIFAPSPRQVSVEQAHAVHSALSPFVARVGVFIDPTLTQLASVLSHVPLDVVQLHGNEGPAFATDVRNRFNIQVIKAIRMRDEAALDTLATYDVDGFLLDTYVPGQPGGTGKTFDWSLAIPVAQRYRIILAGGLTPDNAVEAVRMVRPYAVDVSSGVEMKPGVKDNQLVKQFVSRVRSYSAMKLHDNLLEQS